MEGEKIILILIGVAITTVIQFLSAFLTKKADKKLKHTDQLKLLSSELEDLIRHCIANLNVLKSINLNKGIPSNLHFEKMKVMETSILFSPDTYSFISSNHTRYINRIKLEIRNINLEIDYIIKYKQSSNFTVVNFQQYIDYLISKMEVTIKNLPYRLSELTNNKDTFLKIIKSTKSNNKKIAKDIIYE
tara:strand:- start:4218 stop:4784 length:567 start_codon:yes stop_codon:yes gene_type:complete